MEWKAREDALVHAFALNGTRSREAVDETLLLAPQFAIRLTLVVMDRMEARIEHESERHMDGRDHGRGEQCRKDHLDQTLASPTRRVEGSGKAGEPAAVGHEAFYPLSLDDEENDKIVSIFDSERVDYDAIKGLGGACWRIR